MAKARAFRLSGLEKDGLVLLRAKLNHQDEEVPDPFKDMTRLAMAMGYLAGKGYAIITGSIPGEMHYEITPAGRKYVSRN